MNQFQFDVDYVREQFPALCKTVNGRPAVFADGPGGTQVPVRVVEKIMTIYTKERPFHECSRTSVESDGLYCTPRKSMGTFSTAAREVAFGANTSTTNFKLPLSLLRTCFPETRS